MYKELIEQRLNEAKAARAALSKINGVIVEKTYNPDRGLYLVNYANLLMNRQIDIFDDALLLLENERYQSACIVSRGMIETHAFSRLLNKKVEKILTTQNGHASVDNAIEVILNFTNSSRFKKSEQEKIQKEVFDPNDYMFTEEAKYRFENLLAVSMHVMTALRELYKDEMKQTNQMESDFELTYDILSEYVHPSQTSIYHYYTPETHLVPTSVGNIHTYVHAQLQCVRALLFILEAKSQHYWSTQLANEMTKRAKE
ncbi:DUF5677 domain-containing protein [Escherichia coli]|uniref:DUF5677 domain-containing protein n=1 Tax=Escherichia coli TaxID=562 RepID=UPI0006A46D42|nr:DUF5677 domain-containing protein [Escherichia coli]EFH8724263.1 hypothetical protein [Escherichia coli]EFK3636078.1 hypothetical protein [Escherichia coli]EGI6725815.1 hypothetical protein [Escherichia coli]EGO4464029.1 hypothetical protein [Escherichia coli]EIK7122052.1 hypothetical protein [Escherichia coli]